MSRLAVAIRVRPLNTREEKQGDTDLSFDLLPTSLTSRSQPTIFSFDHVLPPKSSTADVYHAIAHEIVAKATEGENATLFAYGQTSRYPSIILMLVGKLIQCLEMRKRLV